MAKALRNLVVIAEIKASAAETTSQNGADKTDARLQNLKSGILIVTVGPVTGTTPTLDLKLQGRESSTAGYTDLATFAQIVAAGTFCISVPLFKRRLRYVSTIAGTTPSFTYSLVAVGMEFHFAPDAGTIITT